MKTKGLISCAVTFVFAYAQSIFSHDSAQIMLFSNPSNDSNSKILICLLIMLTFFQIHNSQYQELIEADHSGRLP